MQPVWAVSPRGRTEPSRRFRICRKAQQDWVWITLAASSQLCDLGQVCSFLSRGFVAGTPEAHGDCVGGRPGQWPVAITPSIQFGTEPLTKASIQTQGSDPFFFPWRPAVLSPRRKKVGLTREGTFSRWPRGGTQPRLPAACVHVCDQAEKTKHSTCSLWDTIAIQAQSS